MTTVKNGGNVETCTNRTPFQRAPLTTLSVIGLMHSFEKSLIGEWGVAETGLTGAWGDDLIKLYFLLQIK